MRLFLIIVCFVGTYFNINAQGKNYINVLDSLTQKAYQHLYTQQDSAYYYFDEISKLAITNNDWATVIETQINTNRIAGNFYNLEKLQQSLAIVDTIFIEQKKYIDSLSEKLFYKNSILFDKGFYYFKLNDLKKSRNAFSQIIDTTEKLPDSLLHKNHVNLLSSTYNYLAKMYNDEGKYELAKQFYNKNIRFITLKIPNNKEQLFDVYNLLAEVYKNEKEFKKSNTYFLKTLNYNILNKFRKSTITTALIIAKNYGNLQQKDSANYYLKLAKNTLIENDAFLERYHRLKGELYQKDKNYALALKEFNTSLKLVKQKWQHKIHLDIAKVYHEIGQLHAVFDHPEKALKNYNLALEQLSDKNTSRTTVLKILKDKANSLNASLTDVQFVAAIKTVNLGIETLDSLKPTFTSKADKLVLIEDAFPLFESGLESAYNLYKSTTNKKFIDQAFFYAEKSKSALLLEAILSAKATTFGNISNELLEKEKQLKSQITYLEKRINKTRRSTDKLKEKLFIAKREYRSLIKNIETNYKSYYNLKYKTQVISITELQNSLAENEILISYFYGNNAIYTISVTTSSKQFERLQIDENFDDEIRSVYKMLSNPKSDLDVLAKATNKLYNQILKPSIDSYEKTKMIIIADGLLNYIPFGSLNTTENGINYLIENVTISYANSATLLAQLKEKNNKNTSILAFAPNFSDSFENETSKKLLSLPNNTKEVEQILNYFKGSLFTNSEASLKNFTSEISNYGIVHLATHAIINDEFPEYSYLAFTPNKEEEYLLYIQDLYNLNLKANLVTLSACETGLGDLKRGEGFMSLARSFFYSGASSIASTLWKVNDASSTEIMVGFYKNLSEGDTKDVALQKAKVAFIKKNNQNALIHPYYWSGFVISGNTNAIIPSNHLIWFLFGAICLILLGVLIKKRRKN